MVTPLPRARYAVLALLSVLSLAGCATHRAKGRIAPDLPGETMFALARSAPATAAARTAHGEIPRVQLAKGAC